MYTFKVLNNNELVDSRNITCNGDVKSYKDLRSFFSKTKGNLKKGDSNNSCWINTSSDFMCDRFPKALGVLRHKGDNVANLQSVGIDFLNKDQVTGIKVGLGHRVRIYDVHFVTEQVTVIAVEGRYGNHRKDHHRYCQQYHQPDKGRFNDVHYFFHIVEAPFLFS